jgi:GNAT superfamily N-acetyltransferase
MSDITIRPATPGDLDHVHNIWYRAEVEDFPHPLPKGDVPAIFYHELDTGRMYVAEAAGRILGYTALITRGSVSYLAELYVHDDAQSSGLGYALLTHILPPVRSNGGRLVCTLSSDDPRALALYIRAGLTPRWPHYLLHAAAGRLRPARPVAVDVVAAQPGDPDLVRWDAEIGGRPRPADHAFWIEHAEAAPLWFLREGQPIGYGYVQARSHEVALWHPEALALGPLGAHTATDALDCVLAAVAWAAERAPELALGLPAAHPALPVLLAAGFRITYVETFVSTRSDVPFDPACYLPSSSTLF